jgi:uncharacterized protein involved in type VI secretion and phage assembly
MPDDRHARYLSFELTKKDRSLFVARVEGHEGISELFHFDVLLVVVQGGEVGLD